MNKSLLRDCLTKALDSLPTHPQRKHYVHLSFAIVAGKVLSTGYNSSSTPPLHFGYVGRVPEPKTHSELAVYRKLRKRVSINKTAWELINVRVNRSGEMKVSKPCEVCQEWLKSLGCEKVTYTTEYGWKTLNLKN